MSRYHSYQSFSGVHRLITVTLISAFFAGSLQAQMKINEFAADGLEWVELFNASGSPVNVGGWYVDEDGCNFGFPGNSSFVVPAGGFFVIDAGDDGDYFSLSAGGDSIVLCDNSHTVVDQVAYGDEGGAPKGPEPNGGDQHSTARIGDGFDFDNHATDWNIDPTPTKNASNDVAATNLGSSIIINEIELDPAVPGDPDLVGLYNPTGSPIDVGGWAISDGDGFCTIKAGKVVPALGIAILEEGTSWTINGTTECDFGLSDVAYLLDDTGVRVDQLGWANGLIPPNCVMRQPNGAGPNTGYDWATSGGSSSLFATCSSLPVELQHFSIE